MLWVRRGDSYNLKYHNTESASASGSASGSGSRLGAIQFRKVKVKVMDTRVGKACSKAETGLSSEFAALV
jgi:hypothetical protein